LLFGSTQLPKLARSMGSAKKEFEHGLKHGDDHEDGDSAEEQRIDRKS
jgi:Sec-independent protein translocase protein TatA